MKLPGTQDRPSAWLWLLAFACVVIVLCALFPARRHGSLTPDSPKPTQDTSGTTTPTPQARQGSFHAPQAPNPTASEIVAAKLASFADSRRGYAHQLAKRHNVEVPAEVERFFDAVKSGDWERIDASFKAINGGDSSAGHADARPPGVQALWPAIIDAYGAAEQVHEWPAQKLLDYGNAILGSLGPGMVYVGGTDNGRWIPELLNDTSDGERHVVITQNGLADGSYLDYLRLQYGDGLANLTEDESQRVFQDYIDDARKRFQHDQQFPDEPKQVRPHEDIQMVDGKTQVSGQVAVMSINERLLQMLMDKNPDLTFALQESFPLKNTYADAVPLGPLMELRAPGGATAFTADLASQSTAYWQYAAQQVLQDPEAASSDSTMRSWSHDVNSAANLMASHGYSADAEATYQLSSQLWPGNPEPVAA
ncbi:MAG: hypothetical protein ACREIC_01395, partial [Limisphaerales bacterium]